jgi:hypothetical protein
MQKVKKYRIEMTAVLFTVAAVEMRYQKLHPGTPGSMKEIPVI